MSKHRALVYGQPVPQSFLDAMQEFLGCMASPNLDLTMVPGSANQIQIVAGTGSNQVSLGIDGLWRYISATTLTTVSGGAGTYDVFVTTTDNSFAVNPSPPPPELDSTNYAFVLATPLLQGNVPGVAHYRKVGEVIFDGTRILNLRQTVDLDGSQLAQPGDLKLSAVASPPAGWLICWGQAVSRTTYSALYAALGGTSSPWGQGDLSTTFNVPDLRSRFPLGAGQGGGLSNRALGGYSQTNPAQPSPGEEVHTVTNAEMPGHNHTGATTGGTTGGDDRDHTHVSYNYSRVDFPRGTGANVAAVGWGGEVPFDNTSGISTGHLHAVPALGIYTDGGSQPHNNMPPWAAVSYFIKT
jgi:microcystin-dependent protein